MPIKRRHRTRFACTRPPPYPACLEEFRAPEAIVSELASMNRMGTTHLRGWVQAESVRSLPTLEACHSNARSIFIRTAETQSLCCEGKLHAQLTCQRRAEYGESCPAFPHALTGRQSKAIFRTSYHTPGGTFPIRAFVWLYSL